MRALPASVSYILLFYLVVIEPFRDFLNRSLRRLSRRVMLTSLQDGLMTSRQLTSRLRYESEVLIQQSLGLAAWRHLSQGFIRYSLREEILDRPEIFNTDDSAMEALAAKQMHHSPNTGLQVYARHIAQFPKLRGNQQTMFVEFCQRWHTFLGLGKDFDAFSVTRLPISIPGPITNYDDREPTQRSLCLLGQALPSLVYRSLVQRLLQEPSNFSSLALGRLLVNYLLGS